MAAAAPPPLASSEEKTNGAKLSRLLIDGGTTVLRSVFDHHHPPANLAADLNTNFSTLFNLLRRRVLNGHQWDKLFPPGGASPDSNTFDITLLFLLLTTICGLSPPPTGWHAKPPPSDTSHEANLARIKFFRNVLYGHVTTTGVDTHSFSTLWLEITVALVALGLSQSEIDRLKAERCNEDDYLDALRGWADSEEDIKTQLNDMRQTQTKTQHTVQENKSKLEEVHQVVTEIRQSQLHTDQGLSQTLTKTQQTVQEAHETLQENKSKLEEVGQVVTEIRQSQLNTDQGLSQTLIKAQKTVQEAHETLQENKSKLEEVQQIVTETRQSQLNTDQGLIQAQTKTQQTVQDNKTKLDEVHQVVTEIRQAQLNTDQEVDILKKLAEVDTQTNIIKYYAERYLKGTRESVFAKVTNWLDDRNSPNRVMIICGNAGMGKSVIAAEMCKRMQENGKLSGSHFCQHDKARHRNPKVMLQSLACHLSYSLPEYQNALAKQLSRNLGLEVNDMEVADLFELLFEEPLSRLSDPGFTSLVVIDALDESEYQGRNELLDVIAKYFNKLPLWIRFLLTTRPEINIWDSLKNLQPLQLEPNDEENLKDVRHIFEQRLSHCVLQNENPELIVEILVQKSEGLMLWAQLLADFIKENFPILTLEHLDSTIPSGISSVYQSYFKRLENELGKELKITEDQFFNFLSAITAAREPLPLCFVSKLVFPGTLSSAVQRKLNKAIACISSLLPVQDGCIHFFHKSVKDWLVDKSCYGQHNYSVDENKGHRILSTLCIYEFDEVKRKGVDSSEQFSDTTKYALQHGVQHMLESDEDTRSCSLEQLVNMYVLDVELVYAKLCVNNATASEDIIYVKNQDGLKGVKSLGILLFLLRKYSRTLKELPHVIFQMLLNEGGPELSTEALNLLENKYSDIPYMEYLDKNGLQGPVETRFFFSSEVACFDVSPQLDYMVCECHDGTIQLWSLHTGNLIWKRPVVKVKRYVPACNAFRTSFRFTFTDALSCFRSVTFHPIKDAILPGVLSHVYNFKGDLNPLFPECNCVFFVCSISGDTILTDCPDDAKCLILWSLKNGTEITRTTRDEDVLSFARSQDGMLLAISHSTGTICLLDVMNGFKTLAETSISNVCGMLQFSADCRYLFCWHYPLVGINSLFCLKVKMENHETFSLDVSGDTVSYKPWEFESRSKGGFLLGDPFYCAIRTNSDHSQIKEGSFVFILERHSALRRYPRARSIDMVSLDELTKGSDGTECTDTFVHKLEFSLDGETVYLLSSKAGKAGVTAWGVSSGELKAENFPDRENKLRFTHNKYCLLAVREGVLVKTWNTIELWNCELSECIRRWTVPWIITEIIPISDERVVCTEWGEGEVLILSISSGDRLSTIKFLGKDFLGCNRKCQLIIKADQMLQLRYDQTVLWRKQWPFDEYFSLRGVFSPTDQFLVIPGPGKGVYVLDAYSGNTLHLLWKGDSVFDCKFVSDEECIILTYDESSGMCLRLFNVRSGHQLSALDFEKELYCLASCPGKSLIAIAPMCSKQKFKIIKVKLPGENKDDKKNKRRSIKLQE